MASIHIRDYMIIVASSKNEMDQYIELVNYVLKSLLAKTLITGHAWLMKLVLGNIVTNYKFFKNGNQPHRVLQKLVCNNHRRPYHIQPRLSLALSSIRACIHLHMPIALHSLWHIASQPARRWRAWQWFWCSWRPS